MISLLTSVLAVVYFMIHYNKSNYKTRKAIFGKEWLIAKRRDRKNQRKILGGKKKDKLIKKADEEIE